MDAPDFGSDVKPEDQSLQAVLKDSKFWIGVGLSVSSSIFIGGSFIIKKIALRRLRNPTNGKAAMAAASDGGYGYLKDCVWWTGLLTMAFGELLNFVAYAFAPASMVSTLGVLSVLVTTILSSRFLGERLNILGKVGCFLCAIGSTGIVLHAPAEGEIVNLKELQRMVIHPAFIVYVTVVTCASLVLMYHFGPKYPTTSSRTMIIWIGICSMIGSLSVMCAKGFGLALFTTISGESNEFTNWLTYFCLVSLVVTVSVQMNFLNKALDVFNTAVVTPIYYVFFTTCVIIASGILFREFDSLGVADWIGLLCGFLTVLIAIFILNFCKNLDFTLSSLAQGLKIVKDDEKECGGGDGQPRLSMTPSASSATGDGQRPEYNENDVLIVTPSSLPYGTQTAA